VQGKNKSVASVFSFLIILVKVTFKILLALPCKAGRDIVLEIIIEYNSFKVIYPLETRSDDSS
jgi:hypothetical protein